MIRLKDIKRENDCISAKYFPEGQNEWGFIKIGNDKKWIEGRKSAYDEDMDVYFYKAKRELERLLKEENIPSERIIMWY